MPEDRRRYKRFKTHKDVFAAFVVPDEPIIVGKVLDLSPEGAGVQYLGTRKLKKGPTSIRIFGLDSPHMERIESAVIYDLAIAEESSCIATMRRCGIKFERIA